MKKFFTIKLIAIQTIITPATTLFAHDLHGSTGSHWHSIDAFGFIFLAVFIGLALWLGKGNK